MIDEKKQQPEIIYCEQCKHCYRYKEKFQQKLDCYGVCGRLFIDYCVSEKGALVRKNDFCSWAEAKDK